MQPLYFQVLALLKESSYEHRHISTAEDIYLQKCPNIHPFSFLDTWKLSLFAYLFVSILFKISNDHFFYLAQKFT